MTKIEELNAMLERIAEANQNAKITNPKGGDVCVIKVGDNDDVVQSISIVVQESYGGSYGVGFIVCDNIPTRILHKVENKHFQNPFHALAYIQDIADKLNELNREI